MKEVSDVAGCFSSRVRHLLHIHVASGIQKYILSVRKCFRNDQQSMLEEVRMLVEYVTMNATAIRKILKKYDKVCIQTAYSTILTNLVKITVLQVMFIYSLIILCRYIALKMARTLNPRCRLNILNFCNHLGL